MKLFVALARIAGALMVTSPGQASMVASKPQCFASCGNAISSSCGWIRELDARRVAIRIPSRVLVYLIAGSGVGPSRPTPKRRACPASGQPRPCPDTVPRTTRRPRRAPRPAHHAQRLLRKDSGLVEAPGRRVVRA